MEVKFIDIQGTEYTISIPPGSTFATAKEELAKMYNLKPTQLVFFRKQALLNDNTVLNEDMFKDGAKISIFDTSIFPSKTFPATRNPFEMFPQFPFQVYYKDIKLNNRHSRRMIPEEIVRYIGLTGQNIDYDSFFNYVLSNEEEHETPTVNTNSIDRTFLYSGVDEFLTAEERQNRTTNMHERDMRPIFNMFYDNFHEPEMAEFTPIRVGEFENERERLIFDAFGDLSDAEAESVRRLMSQFGLPRAEILQYFDACDRNEQETANLLGSL